MERSKRTTYLVCAVSVLLALLLMGIAFTLVHFLRGDVRESSESPADYGQWALPEKYSQLLIFPQEIPASAKDPAYYYKYESGYTRPMCQIYLRCQMDGADYASESERLAGLSWKDVQVHYDTTSFAKPAYVANAGYDFCYEYALMEEETRTITYVYAMNTLEQDLEFDSAYLPDYFMEDFTDVSVSGLDRFTMYERYQDE